jgi:hypothetical protein
MILTLNLIAALIISTATRPAPPMALAEPVVEIAV